jgi:hypothetical protein
MPDEFDNHPEPNEAIGTNRKLTGDDEFDKPTSPEEAAANRKEVESTLRNNVAQLNIPQDEGYYWRNGWGNDPTTAIANINTFYDTTLTKDGFRVIHKMSDGSIELHKEADFHKSFHGHKLLKTINKGEESVSKLVLISSMWIDAPLTQRRHFYNGTTFNPDPNFHDPSRFNLFNGFPIQPIEGDVSIHTNYLRDIAYDSVEDNYKWGVGWTAQIFQQPHIIMGTMLAIRGSDEGTGKSLYFEILSKLLGRYYVIIDDFEKLKQFNAIAEHAFLVHFEEASWAGDFRAEARFRRIISGQQDLYNQKFEKMRMSQSYHRIGISANPGYIVPASRKARRFGVFNINEARHNDIDYFAKLHHWLDNEDGYAKIMWFYMHFDISQINLRYPPLTVALFENKIDNLKGIHKFIFYLLRSATIPYLRRKVMNIMFIIKICLIISYSFRI